MKRRWWFPRIAPALFFREIRRRRIVWREDEFLFAISRRIAFNAFRSADFFRDIFHFLWSMIMFLRTYTPGPPLDDYVDRFWYCSDTPVHRREQILPSGTVELVINLTNDEIRICEPSDHARPRRYPGAVVAGPYSNFFLIDPLVHASLVGVHFRPGCAAGVLGVAATELADAHVDLQSLW